MAPTNAMLFGIYGMTKLISKLITLPLKMKFSLFFPISTHLGLVDNNLPTCLCKFFKKKYFLHLGWEHIWFHANVLILDNQKPIIVGLRTQIKGDNDTLTQMQPPKSKSITTSRNSGGRMGNGLVV